MSRRLQLIGVVATAFGGWMMLRGLAEGQAAFRYANRVALRDAAHLAELKPGQRLKGLDDSDSLASAPAEKLAEPLGALFMQAREKLSTAAFTKVLWAVNALSSEQLEALLRLEDFRELEHEVDCRVLASRLAALDSARALKLGLELDSPSITGAALQVLAQTSGPAAVHNLAGLPEKHMKRALEELSGNSLVPVRLTGASAAWEAAFAHYPELVQRVQEMEQELKRPLLLFNKPMPEGADTTSPWSLMLSISEKLGKAPPAQLSDFILSRALSDPSEERLEYSELFAWTKLVEVSPSLLVQTVSKLSEVPFIAQLTIGSWCERDPDGFAEWLSVLPKEQQDRFSRYTLALTPEQFNRIAYQLDPNAEGTLYVARAMAGRIAESSGSDGILFARSLPPGPMQEAALADAAVKGKADWATDPELRSALSKVPKERAEYLAKYLSRGAVDLLPDCPLRQALLDKENR